MVRLSSVVMYSTKCSVLKDCQNIGYSKLTIIVKLFFSIAWLVLAVPHKYIENSSELGNGFDDIAGSDYSDLDNMMFTDEIVSTPVTADQALITNDEAENTTDGKPATKKPASIKKNIRRKITPKFSITNFQKNYL